MFLKNKKIIPLICCILFASSFFLTAQTNNSKTVRVGYYENEVFQEGSQPGQPRKGFAYEYYLKLSEYTGWKYEYVYDDFASLYDLLETGGIDFLAGIAYTEERAEKINYPKEIMGSTNYFLLKKFDSVDITQNPESLNGKNIGVLDSVMVNLLRNWLQDHKVHANVIIFKNTKTLLNSYDSNDVDVILVEGTGTYGRQDSEAFVMIGKTDYYIGVSKNRTDLLEQLNEAQKQLSYYEPNYTSNLYGKYYPRSVSSRAFTPNEIQWFSNHPTMNVGYMNHYLPYCDTDKNGMVIGLIQDILPEIIKRLGLQDKIQINYFSYESFTDMIQDLSEDKLDLVCPVGGGLYYSEENGVYQSFPIVRSTVSIVFNKVYSNTEEPIFAVNKNNQMQAYYIRTNYPDAYIKYYDSIEDCFDAILKGQADFTTINGLRVNALLKNSKYKNLKSRILNQNDERCFGVKIGDEALLKIINRGMNTFDEQAILNRAYQYSEKLYSFTFRDLLRNIIIVLIPLLFVFAIVIFVIEAKDKRNTLKFLDQEKKRNEELKHVRDAQEFQLEEIRELNIALEHSRENTERYITDMIRYASSEDDADKILNQIIEYIGTNVKCDRVYVFEENKNHCYDNTYEWCKSGITKEIDNLQNVPYDGVIEIWIDEFKKHSNVIINNLEEYKTVSEPIYEILKPQGICTLSAVPLYMGGRITGFIGVDNPPAEKTMETAELLNLLEFVFSMMIRIRNKTREIEEGALHDQLTGCKNRKALEWAYEGRFNKDKSLAVIAVDMNGLKKVNDNQGHEAGDKFICRTAETLCDVFGKENVYRMGGDEFTVILTEKSPQEFEELMKNCSLQVGTTASLGTIYVETVAQDFTVLMKQADEAMYSEKDRFYQNRKDRRV